MSEEKLMNDKTEPNNFESEHLYSTFYHIKSYSLNPEKYCIKWCIQKRKRRKYSRKKEELETTLSLQVQTSFLLAHWLAGLEYKSKEGTK